MTVEQLILKLQALPKDTNVFVTYHDDYLAVPDISIGEYNTKGDGDRGDFRDAEYSYDEKPEGDWQPAVLLYSN